MLSGEIGVKSCRALKESQEDWTLYKSHGVQGIAIVLSCDMIGSGFLEDCSNWVEYGQKEWRGKIGGRQISKETFVVISASKDGGGKCQETCRVSGVFSTEVGRTWYLTSEGGESRG